MAGSGIGPNSEAGFGIWPDFEVGFGIWVLQRERDLVVFQGGKRDF